MLMHYRFSWSNDLLAQVLGKGDEDPTFAALEVKHLLPFTCCCMIQSGCWLAVQVAIMLLMH